MDKFNFMPYEGNKPYVFVNYEYTDRDMVFPILERLNAEGFRVFYDDSQNYSNELPYGIMERIKACRVFLCVISSNSIENVAFMQKVSCAADFDVQICTLFLEDLVISSKLPMLFYGRPSLQYYKYRDMDEAYETFAELPDFNTCKRVEGEEEEMPSFADSTPSNEFPDFTIVGKTLVKYVGSSTEVTIPNCVKIIGDYAFKNCKDVVNIKLNDGIVEIGVKAFKRCENLVSINLPNSVNTIGKEAFFGCMNLVNVEILQGSQLRNIYQDTFSGCAKLAKIYIPDGVKSIGNTAFYMCDEMRVAEFGANSQLENISDLAFSACNALTEIHLPDSLKTIGSHAFDFCKNLVNVEFGVDSKLEEIGEQAFCFCKNLKYVLLPKNVIYSAWAFPMGCKVEERKS